MLLGVKKDSVHVNTGGERQNALASLAVMAAVFCSSLFFPGELSYEGQLSELSE